jgi:transketolase
VRSTIIRTLAEEATRGIDVHLLTGDLGFRVLDPFREAHPARFTNVGVSEANMVSLAVGMALSGKRPVCYSMVPFLFYRAFESVRLDVVAHRTPVVLVGVGGGLSYGHEGISHHAVEDIAIARSLPGLTVLAPGDPAEAAAAVRQAIRHDGPTFIRVGQNNDPKVHLGPVEALAKPIRVRGDSGRIVVLATGHILAASKEGCDLAASKTGVDVSLYSVPSIKPFDTAFIRDIAKAASTVLTVEEHSVVGVLGSMVAEALFDARWSGRFEKLGLPDSYCETHGSLPWLRKHYGLDAEAIARRIVALQS